MSRRKTLPFASGAAAGSASFGTEVRLVDGRVVRMEKVACCLCGPVGEDRVLTVQDWRYGLSTDPFAIVQCRGCGLSYLNPRPVAQDIGGFYPGNYYERRKRGGGAPPEPGARRVRDEALREQAALCGSVAPGARGRVLDVGCATGTFLAHMKNAGWDVRGIEPSREAAAWGAEALQIEIIDRPLPDAGLPAESFDVVTYWSSLEHVHDPLAYLRETRRVLRPGGRLVVLVPNFASPTVRWLHWGLDPPRHLYHFTPDTLGRLLRAAGFDGEAPVQRNTRIEEGSFHRQVQKIGRRLKRAQESRGPFAKRVWPWTAGLLLARGGVLAAPVSWALSLAKLDGPMVVICRRP
jgi:SAM-dependent methyltransferase